jgi:hypothetical protein
MKNNQAKTIIERQVMTEEEFVRGFLALTMEERAAFVREMQRNA